MSPTPPKQDPTLTAPDYWERINRRSVQGGKGPRSFFIAAYSKLSKGFHSHTDRVFQSRIRPHLPTGGTFIEFGCAPGNILLKTCSRFGLEPHGVEYTELGYEVTKAHFEKCGADPGHVIHADFRDEEFQARFKDTFDVVYSGGLIEHFKNPESVLQAHVNALKPGGLLVVTIPNLRRSLYYYPLKMLGKKILAAHNLEIMTQPQFRQLFKGLPLQEIYCHFLGIVKLPMAAPVLFKPLVRKLQALLDLLLINLCADWDWPNRYTSPHLIYLGRKRPQASGSKPGVRNSAAGIRPEA